MSEARRLRTRAVAWHYIVPGKPQQNAFAESSLSLCCMGHDVAPQINENPGRHPIKRHGRRSWCMHYLRGQHDKRPSRRFKNYTRKRRRRQAIVEKANFLRCRRVDSVPTQVRHQLRS